jgi:uncharacterized membrane protein YoaK (UPF0700 family)
VRLGRAYREEVARSQHHPVEVHSITGARTSLDDDLSQRMRRYLVSMSIRTVCFILAVVCSGWLRWTFASLAIALPYIAVVLANAGPRRRTDDHVGYVPPKNAIEGDQSRRLGS